jgi:PleD family two-component response regulator
MEAVMALREVAIEATRTGPLSVLAVDDDASSRVALARAVRVLGHTCRAATNGEEAWQLHLEQPADVVLCDWVMPQLSGLELCRRLRAEGAGHYVYFVMTTSLADVSSTDVAMDAGADDYLTKPVDLDHLATRLGVAARLVRAVRPRRSRCG